MGKSARERPARLAEKLLQIRLGLRLSQSEMLECIGLRDKAYRHYISEFERGVREPTLPMLLKYARAAGVSVDVVIDDEADLPARIGAARRKKTRN